MSEMNADEERSPVGAAFRDHFAKNPEAARVTLRAQGHVGPGGTCKLETKSSRDEVGVHPALGGTGLTACSGDILLESLVACAGVTLSQIATAMDIELRDAVIRAEGDLDFRGSLGLSDVAPVGLERIRLHFDLDTTANEEEVSGLIRLTERYCVVSRTLNPRAEITYSTAARRGG
jgi:uncharacterized OsmC-like protein